MSFAIDEQSVGALATKGGNSAFTDGVRAALDCVRRRMSAVLLSPDRVSPVAGSAATSTAVSWLIVWVRALTAETLASLTIRGISTGSSPAFALALAHPLSTARAAASPVEGVGLAGSAASGLVGLVDLDHRDPAARGDRASAAP
jgi:hypothetical protein